MAVGPEISNRTGYGFIALQVRDVAKLRGQGLPFMLWQAVALVVFSGVREESHALFLTMFPRGAQHFH
jgi:hypothetical protein